ncbi:ribosome biogenesis GTPase Der [bacterium]|nr:ribosome biogenesis GTPase Der [bacterium]
MTYQAKPRLNSNAIVAIVGRPNVGKSALFNRLTGGRRAIVEDTPGITRDRIYGVCEWNGRVFSVCDTGGIDPDDPDILRRDIHKQAEAAVDEADLVLFVVDVRAGVQPLDEEVAEILRRHKKPVLLVANKAETLEVEANAVEFYALGMGEPYPVSAIHGMSTGDLLDAVLERLPAEETGDPEEEISVVLVGRPNVGKSSTLNRLIGQERSIVHDQAGTTRDSVDISLDYGGRAVKLVDTAGMRRQAKVDESIEYYSSLRASQSLEKADVAVLVIDARDGVVAQDKRVAGEISEACKPSVIVVNKWDLLRELAGEDGQGPANGQKIAEWKEKFIKKLGKDLEFMAYSPVIFASALTGEGTEEILEAALEAFDESRRRVPTPVLNHIIKEAAALRPPPSYKGDRLKIKYVSQRPSPPPCFTFKCNSPDLVHFSYKRYLENQLREAFGFVGTPITLKFVK